MINKYDAYTFIMKVIESCNTLKQVRNCKKLLGGFQNYKDDFLSEHLRTTCRTQEIVIANEKYK